MAQYRAVRFVLLLLLLTTAPPAAGSSITDADRALLENRFADAVELYTDAAGDASDGPARARAYRGLAAARLARIEGLEAIDACLEAILADPAHPGNIGLAKVMEEQVQTAGIPENWDERYEQVVHAAEGLPALREYLIDPHLWVLRSRGEFDAARELREGYADVEEFLVAGPFSNTGGSGIYEEYPPEQAIDVEATYTDHYGRPFAWEAVHRPVTGRVDFDLIFSDDPDAVGYALTHVKVEEETKAVASIFGSDAFRMWVNGEPVLRERTVRLPGWSLYEVPVTLTAGWNRVLVKAAAERAPLIFSLSFCDLDGKGLRLESSADPAVYDGGGRPGKPVPESMATYTFESLPQNYWLRAWRNFTSEAGLPECYVYLTFLRRHGFEVEMDRAVDDFMKRFPGSALIAGERAALLQQTNRAGEAAALIRRTVADAPEYTLGAVAAVDELLEQGELDAVWDLVVTSLEPNPECDVLLSLKAAATMARGDIAAGLSQLERLFEKSPRNTTVREAYLMSMFEVAGDELRYRAALERALEYRKDDRLVLARLAGIAYRKGEYDVAVSYLDRALEAGERFDTVSLAKGSILEKAGRLEEAAEEFEAGAARCPRSAALLESAGRLLHNMGEEERAVVYYTACAEREVRAFPTRDLIRRLKEEPPLDDFFPDVDIASLNSEDMSWAGEGADAITLLDSEHVIVYENGSYEVRRHVAVKVLNRAGVEFHGEADVPFFMDSSAGEVEIARTVKPDGREVQADRGFMQVSFADVEPGDVVELRYVSRNGPTVGLPGHFWYRHFFQSITPVLESRLALLVPSEMAYDVKMHRADVEPVTSDHGDWRLDVWQARRMPALPVESRMPPATEQCAWVNVSTIGDWDEVASWYRGVSRGRLAPGRDVLALAEELTAGAAGDSAKIHAVTNYVRERIKYEDVGFSESGFVPRPVDEVLRTRLGDCKDQSVLIASLLRASGVAATLALVNSRDEATVEMLPSPRFTHCIVRAVASDGAAYWIDPTTESISFPNVPVELEGAQALPVDSAGVSFVEIDLDPPDANGSDSSLEVVVDERGDCTVTGKSAYRGEDASSYRHIALYYAERLDEAVRDVIASEHPAAVVDSAKLTGASNLDDDMVLSFSFRRAGAVSRAGNLSILGVSWTIGRVPYDLVSLEERQTPLVLDSWRGRYTETVELELPEGYALQNELPLVDISCDAASFSITGETRGDGSIVLRKELQINVLRVEPDDYPAFRSFLEKAWRAEESQLVFASG